MSFLRGGLAMASHSEIIAHNAEPAASRFVAGTKNRVQLGMLHREASMDLGTW